MSIVPPSIATKTPRNSPAPIGGRRQLSAIDNTSWHQAYATTRKVKPVQKISLTTFNRFDPLNRLGKQMDDPFVTTPPQRRRLGIPLAPMRPAIHNQFDTGPNARGRAARQRPRKSNGQFAKKSREQRPPINEDVEMDLGQPDSGGHKVLAPPRESIEPQGEHDVDAAFRRIEGVARELENLRKGLLAIIDVRSGNLESKVSIMQQEMSNRRKSPGVHFLHSELKRQQLEAIRMERGIKMVKEDMEDDRIEWRQAKDNWEDDIERVEGRIRDISWSFEVEIAKVKSLVEKHEEAVKVVEWTREKLPDGSTTLAFLQEVAGRVDHLQTALSQTLTVQTRAGNCKFHHKQRKTYQVG
jgi:hypothetical protein